ncbi:MAG: AarF/ABC1/UbiB kinase family protein [Pseudomonadales bacterium]
MAKKSAGLSRSSVLRSLSVSIAGARTGGAMVADSALNKIMPGRKSNALLEREAKNFAAELGRLKGTYVKVGQMLALLGEHFLPAELTEALHELDSQTFPLPWEAMQPAMEERMGECYHQLIIDEEPLAAASLAQVHRAEVIATGEQIVLKVLYPGVQDTIDVDFNAVVRMLKMTRWVKSSREFSEWLEIIREQLHLEVDYKREAKMMRRMQGLLDGDERYLVPKVYTQFCSAHVLAMEYVDGEKVTSDVVSDLPQRQRNTLAKSMLDLFFHEIYQWRFIQTDPNFGNYLITQKQGKTQLVLLDFGSVMECSATFCRALGATIKAGQLGDRAGVIAGLIELGCLDEDSAEGAKDTFGDFCLHILEPLRDTDQLPDDSVNGDHQYCWGRSDLLRRAGKNAAKSVVNKDFSMPSQEFAFIARKLTGVFTFIAVLDAEFNGGPILQKHIQNSRKSSATKRKAK